VEALSSDVESLLGRAPEGALGQSVLRLVHADDVPALLRALAEATRTRRSVTLGVRVVAREGGPVPCQLVVVPLVPPPSVTFVLLPGGATDSAGVTCLSSLPRARMDALSRLTTRETDIVARLMSGDRVPAIATALFLSQSTVRNHLSAAFRKLHVRSQQELVDLLRDEIHLPMHAWG
jgi:DNA-binding CsgD family transcriptional regulator